MPANPVVGLPRRRPTGALDGRRRRCRVAGVELGHHAPRDRGCGSTPRAISERTAGQMAVVHGRRRRSRRGEGRTWGHTRDRNLGGSTYSDAEDGQADEPRGLVRRAPWSGHRAGVPPGRLRRGCDPRSVRTRPLHHRRDRQLLGRHSVRGVDVDVHVRRSISRLTVEPAMRPTVATEGLLGSVPRSTTLPASRGTRHRRDWVSWISVRQPAGRHDLIRIGGIRLPNTPGSRSSSRSAQPAAPCGLAAGGGTEMSHPIWQSWHLSTASKSRWKRMVPAVVQTAAPGID